MIYCKIYAEINILYQQSFYLPNLNSVSKTVKIVVRYTVGSDGHDKPLCTKAIIDNFKKALGDTYNR